MKIRLSAILGAAAISAQFASVFCSSASPLTLYLDSSRSSLTFSGTAFTLNITPQAGRPGSLLDAWSGTIQADLTGGVLTFAGGSSISALLNPAAATPFSTFPYPTTPPGSIDNYGVFGSGLVSGVGAVLGLNGSYRSLTLDITAGSVADSTASTGMTLGFTSGHLEWGAVVAPNTLFGGTSSLVGVNGANNSVLAASWDGTTLTLPISLHTTGNNRTEDWNGTLVAVIPEPSTVSLALLGAGFLALSRKSRFSRI